MADPYPGCPIAVGIESGIARSVPTVSVDGAVDADPLYFARRADLRLDEVAVLAADGDYVIRLCIAKRPDLTAEQVGFFVRIRPLMCAMPSPAIHC